MPARTTGSMPSPPRWLLRAKRAAGNGRSRGRLGSAAPAFREARRLGDRAYPSAQPPARASTRPRPRWGNWKALDPPSCPHPARHPVPGRLGPPPPAAGFGDLTRHSHTAAKDRRSRWAHRSRSRSFRHHPHRDLWRKGPILAAKIIGAVGNVVRFPTKAHFASYSGTTAPMEASSGEVVRHRLSLVGNRKLNNALHMVARLCQGRSDIRGGAYYRKKIAEGKSRKEALRCLKRRISDAVFKSLMADLQAPSCSAA